MSMSCATASESAEGTVVASWIAALQAVVNSAYSFNAQDSCLTAEHSCRIKIRCRGRRLGTQFDPGKVKGPADQNDCDPGKNDVTVSVKTTVLPRPRPSQCAFSSTMTRRCGRCPALMSARRPPWSSPNHVGAYSFRSRSVHRVCHRGPTPIRGSRPRQIRRSGHRRATPPRRRDSSSPSWTEIRPRSSHVTIPVE